MSEARKSHRSAFSEFVPYYYQIAGLIEREISEGEFPQGSKLPNELELAKLFGVSRVTVRNALAILHSKGLLLRQRGRGTFISEDLAKAKTVSLNGLIEEFSMKAQGAETRLLSIDSVPCPNEALEFFGFSRGTLVSRIQRLGIADRRPFSYVTHYLPAKLMKRIPGRDLRRHSMSRILEERLGHSIGEYRQTIEAQIADRRIAELLGIGITSPVVFIETFCRSGEGEALDFFRSYYPADRYKYTVVLRKDASRSPLPADGRTKIRNRR